MTMPSSHIEKHHALIRSQACFRELTVREQERLVVLLHEEVVESDQSILSKNDMCHSIYFILSGLIEANQQDVPQAVLYPGEAIGLQEWIVRRKTFSTAYKTLTKVVLLRLDLQDF
jgi:CRP-like cAMP-binding protein